MSWWLASSSCSFQPGIQKSVLPTNNNVKNEESFLAIRDWFFSPWDVLCLQFFIFPPAQLFSTFGTFFRQNMVCTCSRWYDKWTDSNICQIVKNANFQVSKIPPFPALLAIRRHADLGTLSETLYEAKQSFILVQRRLFYWVQ